MRGGIVVMFAAALAAGACGHSEAASAASASPAQSAAAAPAANAEAAGRAAAPDAPATAPASAPEAAARREVTIPSGTLIHLVLDTPVGSDTSRVEQRVAAHLSQPIVVRGQSAVPAGSRVGGVVTDARRSGKVKGLAHVAVKFESLSPSGEDERYPMQASAVGRTAASTKKKDALEIGAPAAGGALIGALVGGKKGALVGGAVGGGAGTAVVMSTRGKEVHIPKGTALTLKLTAPLTVRVRS